jgi:hypothetical protein
LRNDVDDGEQHHRREKAADTRRRAGPRSAKIFIGLDRAAGGRPVTKL